MQTIHNTGMHREAGITQSGSFQDISGYTIFSSGDTGAAHAMAHRMLDEGRIEEGHFLLGAWLDGRTGSGSEWVHLHFHMAVFELELGDWEAAFHRYTEHVLPAMESHTALTDGPALAWRLSLTAESTSPCPWAPVRDTALDRLEHHDDPWVDLHNALALAGAGDVGGLELWMQSKELRAHSRLEFLVLEVAEALRSFAIGDFFYAATQLTPLLPRISAIGGSRAQNELFSQIERACWSRLSTGASISTASIAA